MIKVAPVGKFQIPNVFPGKRPVCEGYVRFLPVLNNPGNLATARRSAAPRRQKLRKFLALFGFYARQTGHGGSVFASGHGLNYEVGHELADHALAGRCSDMPFIPRLDCRLEHLNMPDFDFRGPRLFIDAPLAAGETIELERNQSNYLGNVLRLAAGESVLVFNGCDGEWQASIAGRKRAETLNVERQTRPQDRLPDIAYVFAPLKHARLDYMVQKAVEMGASMLQPVLTRFTQVSRVNGERMRANAIEAAEQCGILTLAAIAEPLTLDRYLGQRDASRLLVFCDEATDVADPVLALRGERAASGGIDILIGPEGGFAEEERAVLLRQPRTLRISLGPRVLRADTAGVAALALVQATLGDWTRPAP
jgi:16S rRNA (uracil1498-N3)-methyltransferase